MSNVNQRPGQGRGRKRPQNASTVSDTWNPDGYPYQVDYNDHFETPLVAYQDIAPLLEWLGGPKSTSSRQELRVYDPYYCNGQTERLFRQLGFEGIINEKRDFYADHDQDQLPEHDILVTNPPYSDQHKIRCLDILLEQLRSKKNIPFLCLMPNYVAAREYFASRIQDEEVCFLIPCKPYEYCHPEGTGKQVPPFESIWYCGLGRERIHALQEFWDPLEWPHSKDRPKPTLVISIEDLKTRGLVPTMKRGNPRQRKKRRQHAQSQTQTSVLEKKKEPRVEAQSTKQVSSEPGKNHQQGKGKQSKYRDDSGKRKRKRF